jgi:hypothetical protein
MSEQSDAPLIRRISEAFDELPPIPSRLSGAARSAFEWRRADASLAALLFDSANDELVGVRGTASDRRSFRFGSDEYVIRVHLTPATLIVMLEPPLSVPCRIATEDGIDDHRTDELGELVVPAPDLPARVEVELPNGTVVTPWMTG